MRTDLLFALRSTAGSAQYKIEARGLSVPIALCAISSNSKIALLLMGQPGGAARQRFAGAVSNGETHGHGCGCHRRD